MATTAARQDEDFGWLVGIDDANGVLLLAPGRGKGARPEEILLLPPRNAASERWIGPRAYAGEEWAGRLGVAATGDLRKAEEELKQRLRGVKTVFLPRQGASADYAEKLFGDLVRGKGAETADLRALTGKLRLAKSAEEIARIRRASVLTAEGHRRASGGAGGDARPRRPPAAPRSPPT